MPSLASDLAHFVWAKSDIGGLSPRLAIVAEPSRLVAMDACSACVSRRDQVKPTDFLPTKPLESDRGGPCSSASGLSWEPTRHLCPFVESRWV